ncbi:MAG: hypothetical protein CSB44_02100 [Gammaproteobacteria bacterium]|nr:MAG: hypothetical protein CSB44_02100 [Gammaproteobacteria bacterium]PIE35424.1 MAG: hypothetical protein CSA54_05605 [Gammaproteobacteria bacterium]
MTGATLDTLRDAAAAHGMLLRGVLAVQPADEAIVLANGREAVAIALFGNTGDALWPVFTASAEYRDGERHPLDRWSRRVATIIAAPLGARVLMPNDGPPHLPFLSWAERAGGVTQSPIGLFLHREYGLWHAYRFALALGEMPEGVAGTTTSRDAAAICANCVARPCLTACPVGAFTNDGYAVDRCAEYLLDDEDAPCHGSGCLARVACPVGAAARYPEAQRRFHMASFLRGARERR